MKEKFVRYYTRIARETAELSHAKRKQVGAIIVKDNRIISIGYNGMPSGFENECEYWVKNDGVNFAVNEQDFDIYCSMVTKPEVLHAETNAISKVARSSESCLDADLFVTCTPCIECAKLIHQSGIKRVFYASEYEPSKGNGLEFLNRCGITVEKVNVETENQVQALED